MDSLRDYKSFIHDITGKLYTNIYSNSFKDNHNFTTSYNTNMDGSEIGIKGLNFVGTNERSSNDTNSVRLHKNKEILLFYGFYEFIFTFKYIRRKGTNYISVLSNCFISIFWLP